MSSKWIYKARCGIKECESHHYAKGLCKPHYMRVLFEGDPGGADDFDRRRKKRTPVLCSIAGCVRKYYAKNLCQGHYLCKRAMTIAGPDQPRCSVPGCKLLEWSKKFGMCMSHNMARSIAGKLFVDDNA